MVTGSLQKVLALSGALLGRRARVALRAAVARVANASEIKPHADTSTPVNPNHQNRRLSVNSNNVISA
jgi:hypothetical protein